MLSSDSFYHITPYSNVDKIIAEGLKWGKQNGICVITTNHELIIEYVTEMFLVEKGDKRFAVFQIDPIRHKLSPTDIMKDSSSEFTNPLHRYIKRDKLFLRSSDYIQSYITWPYGIPDLEKLKADIRKADLIKN
jgi:hypothetical protein